MNPFDPFNADPLINTQRIAYHEAGHAVAAWALNIPVCGICVKFKSGHTDIGSFEAVKESIGEIDARRHWAIQQLSGGVAQRRWRSDMGYFGCDDDNASARENIERIADLTGRPYDDCSAQLIAEAEHIVAREWSRLERLAARLCAPTELSGEQVRAVIEGKS